MRSRNSLMRERREAFRDARLIVIASEGKDTERIYFKALAKEYTNPRVHVHILERSVDEQNNSSPEHVLKQLNDYKNLYDLEADDELWLVVDKDQWKDKMLSRVATECALEVSMHMALSNSCFELWGNHSLNVADLDGDGLDEVMYGSMAVDHDGIGLWNTRLGHGDANHVGKFLPEREGLQMFHCLETGKTMVALHDARDGSVIWKKDAASDNDMGRCLVGDFFPEYPGCEFFYYQGNYIQQDGTETNINTKGQKGGCGMAVWFDGNLSRQLIEDNIIQSPKYGRTFTMYRYSETFINGTKSNPSWYGDIVGDWREEIILPDTTRLQDIKIFSTWYPTTHKFPWLMTDHCYWMSCLNENIGYNQPTHTGYYLGSDLKNDAEAWAEAEKVQNIIIPTAVNTVITHPNSDNSSIYNLSGQRVNASYKGIIIKNGKKLYNK